MLDIRQPGDSMSAPEPSTDPIAMLRDMFRIRIFENEIYRQVDEGNVRGTTHVSVGQEAVAVGACSVLGRGDLVTSTHRGHGHFLASGGDMKRIMAELFGRRDGYCQGKGGTQHMASVEAGFVGSNGITGGGLPFATGMALAKQMRGEPHLVLCFFGDGAVNQGTFHESLNLASIWRLPVVYILENNQYAMSSPVRDMVNVERLADRAAAYGIPGMQVDGNDVADMARIAAQAAEHARHGAGPVLVEALTYRVSGHSRNDRCQYRSREEEQVWTGRCPIGRLRDQLLQDGTLDESAYQSIERVAAAEVAEAVEFAMGSDYLCPEEVLAGVFAETSRGA